MAPLQFYLPRQVTPINSPPLICGKKEFIGKARPELVEHLGTL